MMQNSFKFRQKFVDIHQSFIEFCGLERFNECCYKFPELSREGADFGSKLLKICRGFFIKLIYYWSMILLGDC